MALFGFGDTEKHETTNVSNQQVATQSGIATGGTGNTSYITTADPEVAKAAIQDSIAGNAAISGKAFDFASGAVGAVEQANAITADTVKSTANLAILANNDLSTKFLSGVSDVSAHETSLLQSLAQNENEQQLRSQDLSKAALDASFTNAARSTPQTVGYTTEATIGSLSKIILYVVIGVAAVFVAYAFRRK